MAGYGKHAEAALKRVVDEEKGKYLVVVEGAIPTADDGVYCTIGGRTALDIAREVCSGAAATIAVGRLRVGWRSADGRIRIPPARWACMKRCRESRSSICPAARTIPSIRPPFWCITSPLACCLRSIRLQPAAVCLRPADPRPVRAPRALRRRALCAGVGRRRPSQGLVPLQNGLQGSGGQLQLPDGALERCDQLAGEVRSRLHRLRLLALLGYEVALLRAAAASGRVWRGCHRRPRSAGPWLPVLPRPQRLTRSDMWSAITSTPATETPSPRRSQAEKPTTEVH